MKKDNLQSKINGEQVLSMEKLIYLDNAATTATRPEVLEAMLPYFGEYYGNAASIYRFAGKSTKAVDEARRTEIGRAHV